MRRRSVLTLALAVLISGAIAALGLVLVPGVSQAAKKPPPQPLYLSLGDSYSIGYQPGIGGTPGYTAWVARKTHYQLENFGCGGATTTSILQSVGCSSPAATDAVPYTTTTQEQAALDFIADPANYGRIGLITVSIGGNDVTACASNSDPVSCVGAAATTIKTNVGQLVGDLGSALAANGDSGAKLIGLTYPDVILGDYVFPPGSPNTSLANLSVIAFDDIINPTLSAAYTSVPGGSFVNVTTAPYKQATAGDDTPLTTTTKLRPYGTVPVAVWEICKLTYFCSQGNIHADTKGYDFIGQLVFADFSAS